jgi:hypothetical protein
MIPLKFWPRNANPRTTSPTEAAPPTTIIAGRPKVDEGGLTDPSKHQPLLPRGDIEKYMRTPPRWCLAVG